MVNLRGTDSEDPEYLPDYLKADPDKIKQYIHEGIEKTRQKDLDPSIEWGPIDMDPGIAPIVEGLNSAGFMTLASCQGRSSRHPKGMWPTATIVLGGRWSDLSKTNLKDIRTIIRSHTQMPYDIVELKSGRQTKIEIQFSRSL